MCGALASIASAEFSFLDADTFLGTATTWTCTNGGSATTKPASVTCAHYSGAPLPCNPGSYSETGFAPDGECSSSCPSAVSYSPPGSSSSSDCVALSSCAQVSMVGSCAGTSTAIELEGVSEPFEGDCPGTSGAQVFKNGRTGL